MKLIVGLGNPGIKYAKTRHNIGFMFIDKYARLKNVEDFKEKFNGAIGTFKVNGETIILLKPLTYMNLSGNCVRDLASYYNIDHKDILVIYDDKDIPFANLRLREKGNPGSHNGMKNISTMIQDINFPRIRVGIGSPAHPMDMADFVLSKFTEDELKTLDRVFDDIAASCDLFIKNDFNMAMNKYNARKN